MKYYIIVDALSMHQIRFVVKVTNASCYINTSYTATVYYITHHTFVDYVCLLLMQMFKAGYVAGEKSFKKSKVKL